MSAHAGTPEGGTPYRVVRALILLAASVAVLYGTFRSGAPTETARSRLATVLSLADDRSWYIDRPSTVERNPFEATTVDKVQVDGRLISSKPPLLPLMMTAEYVVLRAVFGWELLDEDDRRSIVSVMSLTLIGIPFLLGLFFFDRTTGFFVADPFARAVGLFGVAFGTQLWGFASSINNHIPAAASLMVAFYFAFGLGTGALPAKRWRFVAFGFFGALAATFDVPVAIFVALAGVFLLSRFPRETLLWTIAGVLPPLVLHFGIMIAVTGSPLPVQMNQKAYMYEGSYWRNPRGVDALNHRVGTYLFHMTFGRVGVFLLYPITFLGLVSLGGRTLWRDARFRPLLLVGAVGFAAMTAYYALRTNNYGGVAFGFRWYIVAMPVLVLMATGALAGCRRGWQISCVAVLLAVSVYSGWLCFLHPWEVDAEWTTRLFGPTL